MAGGVLEVLIVNAEGLKRAKLLGSSSLYAIIECGSKTTTSKLIRGEDGKAWWNEKISFNLSSLDMKDLKRIKLRIMVKDKLLEDYSIGETIIHVMDILTETTRRGSIDIKPSPYVIVLNDKTYRGKINVGLKFFSPANVLYAKEVPTESRESSLPEMQSQPLYKTILNFALHRIWSPRITSFFMPTWPKSSTEPESQTGE